MKNILLSKAVFLFLISAIVLTGCNNEHESHNESENDPDIKDELSVIYDGNGNTGGSAPVDENIYFEGYTVTVMTNTGSLERTGYSFKCWNTEADRTGTGYEPSGSDTLVISASGIKLYAEWRPVNDNDGNTGSGDNGNEDDPENNSEAVPFSLLLSAGGIYPAFSEDIYDYYGYIPSGDSIVSLTVVMDPETEAVCEINNQVIPLSMNEWQCPLNPDENELEISAVNGPVQKRYHFTLNRGYYPSAMIKPSNAGEFDHFGQCVAIDNDTIVAGSPQEAGGLNSVYNGTDFIHDDTQFKAGAAYVFRRNGSGWEQEAYLKAPNADKGDKFGSAVAVSGDTVVVGAYNESNDWRDGAVKGPPATDNNDLSWSGAAYVYKRNGNEWRLEAYLKASNADMMHNFGQSVAVDGDIIAVGAPCEGTDKKGVMNGSYAFSDNYAPYSGAVYIFEKTGNIWEQTAYVKAPNNDTDNSFGFAVALSGNDLVVTARYEDSAINTVINGDGAGGTDRGAYWSGAAYVYKKEGGSWVQKAYLKANNPGEMHLFGSAADIDGDRIIIGTIFDDSDNTGAHDDTALNSGAAHVFKRDAAGNWDWEGFLKPASINAGDSFGNCVAIHDGTILIGAENESGNYDRIFNNTMPPGNSELRYSGAAYVFKRCNGQWEQAAFLKAPNAKISSYFGCSAAAYGGCLVIGAKMDSSYMTGIIGGFNYPVDTGLCSSGGVYVISE